MKNNVVDIDWSDDILARTVLTHGGENKAALADEEVGVSAAKPPGKSAHAKSKSATAET